MSKNQHTTPMPSADEIIGWLQRYDVTRLDDALAAMGDAYGARVTYEAVRGKLRRAGRGAPTSHMRGAARATPIAHADVATRRDAMPPPAPPMPDDEIPVDWDEPSPAQSDASRRVLLGLDAPTPGLDAPTRAAYRAWNEPAVPCPRTQTAMGEVRVGVRCVLPRGHAGACAWQEDSDAPPRPVPMQAPSVPRVEAVPRDARAVLEDSRRAERERVLRAELDALTDHAREAEARARVAERLRADPYTPRIVQRERTSGKREGTLVALASDWHVEETVDSQAVAGRNSYSMAVAAQRARRFFDGIRGLAEHHRASFAIRDVVLWLGGDLISGYIHPELAEANEASPVEAVIFAQRLVADGIASLLADPGIESLTVPCSYGNHGRTTEKRRIKTGAANSYEWMMYAQLADRFAHDKRVSFVVDRSAHQYVECYGRTLHFTHGDEVKYQGGVGGIAVPLLRRVPAWDSYRRADLHHIGHFHQRRDFGHALVNGSLIGPSEYGVSVGASYEPPEQQSYVLDARRGKCLVTPIWVADEESERSAA